MRISTDNFQFMLPRQGSDPEIAFGNGSAALFEVMANRRVPVGRLAIGQENRRVRFQR